MPPPRAAPVSPMVATMLCAMRASLRAPGLPFLRRRHPAARARPLCGHLHLLLGAAGLGHGSLAARAPRCARARGSWGLGHCRRSGLVAPRPRVIAASLRLRATASGEAILGPSTRRIAKIAQCAHARARHTRGPFNTACDAVFLRSLSAQASGLWEGKGEGGAPLDLAPRLLASGVAWAAHV